MILTETNGKILLTHVFEVCIPEESIRTHRLDKDADDRGIGDDFLPDSLDDETLWGAKLGSIGNQEIVPDEQQAKNSENKGIHFGVFAVNEHHRYVT